MNKEFKHVNTLLEIDGLVIDEENGSYLKKEQIEAIENALEVDNVEAIATAVNEVENAHKIVVVDLEAKQTETEKEKPNLEAAHKIEVEDSVKVLAELQAKYDAMETEYNASKAKGMKLNNGEPIIGEIQLTDKEKNTPVTQKQLLTKYKNLKIISYGNIDNSGFDLYRCRNT